MYKKIHLEGHSIFKIGRLRFWAMFWLLLAAGILTACPKVNIDLNDLVVPEETHPTISNNGFYTQHPPFYTQVADRYSHATDADQEQTILVEYGTTQLSEVVKSDFMFKESSGDNYVKISIWKGDKSAFSRDLEGAGGYINTSGPSSLNWDDVFSTKPDPLVAIEKKSKILADGKKYDSEIGVMKDGSGCYLVQKVSKETGFGGEIYQSVIYAHNISCDTYSRIKFGKLGAIDKDLWAAFHTNASSAYEVLPFTAMPAHSEHIASSEAKKIRKDPPPAPQPPATHKVSTPKRVAKTAPPTTPQKFKPKTAEVANKDSIPRIVIVSPRFTEEGFFGATQKDLTIEGIIASENPVNQLTVNGQNVRLQKDGSFATTMQLKSGNNPIFITAKTKYDATANKVLLAHYGKTAPKQARPEPVAQQQTPPPPEPTTAHEDQFPGLGTGSKLKIRPNCWVLAVGVSKYAETGMELEYGAHDAMTFANALEKQEGKLFDQVNVVLLIDQDVTRDKIMKAVTEHLNRAAPDDLVAIFMAGHGIRHRTTDTYYFLTYDSSPSTFMYRGLRWSDFELSIDILSRNVNKIMLALDTCHSGFEGTSYRAIDSGENLAQRLKEASGLYLIGSSKSGEVSVESSQFRYGRNSKGHGAFTYALVKGMDGAADTDNDKVVTLYELSHYVSKIVPNITRGQQHPYSRLKGTDMPFTITK